MLTRRAVIGSIPSFCTFGLAGGHVQRQTMDGESDEEYVYSDLEDEDDDQDLGASAGVGTGGGGSAKSGGDVGGRSSHNRSSSISDMLGTGGEEVKVISEDELRQLMEDVVAEVAAIMSVPVEAATALLRHFSWNTEKLYDQVRGRRGPGRT